MASMSNEFKMQCQNGFNVKMSFRFGAIILDLTSIGGSVAARLDFAAAKTDVELSMANRTIVQSWPGFGIKEGLSRWQIHH